MLVTTCLITYNYEKYISESLDSIIKKKYNFKHVIIIRDYTQIGSQATILPNIVIGKNVIVAAGAVVTKNVPNNCMVAGVPALVKKQIDPLKF